MMKIKIGEQDRALSRDYSLLNPVLGRRRSIVMAAARGAGLQRQVVNVAAVRHSAGGGGKAGGAVGSWAYKVFYSSIC